jgi:hypothetical protein
MGFFERLLWEGHERAVGTGAQNPYELERATLDGRSRVTGGAGAQNPRAGPQVREPERDLELRKETVYQCQV